MSEQVMQRLKVKVMGSYFCLRQHFHNDRNEEEDNCSVEVESAKEKNGLLEKRENLEGDHNQDTGERACSSLEKVLKKFSGFGSFEVPPCKVPSLQPGRVPRS